YWLGGPFDTELCELFEIALARSDDSLYAWLLERAYARRGAARDVWTAACCAERELGNTARPPQASTCLESIGVAVLRSESQSEPLAVVLPFGPYGGSHTHMDRLALNIWPWSPDAGTPPYGAELRGAWYAQTAAHNTVLVDGQSQQPGAGQLLAWQPGPSGGSVKLAAPAAFPGVSFTRAVALDGDTLHDTVELAASESHTFDWLLHCDGEFTLDGPALAAADGPFDSGNASSWLRLKGKRNLADQTLSERVCYGGRSYRFQLTASAPCDIYLADGPGTASTPTARRQVLIARTHGKRASFTFTVTTER
ncbi:MAG: heparinase II/III-family protein, partial [Chloroflexaceae bacterium]|nr:heparinase II/III-family protein [Chloroflexaceae bacterium]